MLILKKCLRALTMPALEDLAGTEIVQGLNSFDIPITKLSLISIIFDNKGFSILRNRDVLNELIEKNEDLLKENTEIDFQKLTTLKWNKEEDRKKLIIAFGGETKDTEIVISKREKLLEVEPEGQTLFPYQNWMRKKILEFLISDKRRTLIHMPTGSGKTKTSMNAIIDFMRHEAPRDVTVIWLAHSDELCEQAHGTFLEIWSKLGVSECNVWRLWRGYKELEYQGSGLNFIVTSFQTAYSWLKTSDDRMFEAFIKMKNKCDLLLIDEAHLSTAETYEAVIDKLAGVDKKRIGLTATPGRHGIGSKKTETENLVTFYENELIKMTDDQGKTLENPIKFLQDQKILSSIEGEVIEGGNYELNDKDAEEIGKNLELSPRVLRRISNDQARFLNIANKVYDYASKKSKQTIVFCPSKNNSLHLSAFLNHAKCTAAAITSDLDMMEREEKIEAFRRGKIKVLTNFNVLTTGFDAPNIEVVVIARPTLSVVLYSQMIGRGLRGSKVGGTDNVILVDVRDNISNLPDALSAFTFFNEFYK